MFRKIVGAAIVMTVAIGFVAADEFVATITKVDGNKVTYQKYKKSTEKGKKGEKDGNEVTANAEGAKILKGGKKGTEPVAIEGGLSNEIFKSKKGVTARITTEGDKITQIVTIGGKAIKKKAAQ